MKRRVEPPKLPKFTEREHLTRSGKIAEWCFELLAHGASGPSVPKRWGSASLSALGNFSEPINAVDAFEIAFVGVDGEAIERNAFVGKILRAKPVVVGAVSLPWPDLDALVTFAAAGRTLYCSTRFEKPRYGSGDILSFTVSTKRLGSHHVHHQLLEQHVHEEPAWVQTIVARLDVLTSAVTALSRVIGTRLTRAEMCTRLGICSKTLTDRVRRGVVPSPSKDGKWLLSELMEWESRGG